MKKTSLRNRFRDSKTDADRIVYKNQDNYCVGMIQEKMPISVTLKYMT